MTEPNDMADLVQTRASVARNVGGTGDASAQLADFNMADASAARIVDMVDQA